MGQTLTYVTELLVGLGCLAAAVATSRSPHLRWLAFVLGVAGVAAIVHAIAELVG
jgi:peptidoglycan/LPS O-acetylase OafA/YrhL